MGMEALTRIGSGILMCTSSASGGAAFGAAAFGSTGGAGRFRRTAADMVGLGGGRSALGGGVSA